MRSGGPSPTPIRRVRSTPCVRRSSSLAITVSWRGSAIVSREAAGLEAVHGDPRRGPRPVRNGHRLAPPRRRRRQHGRRARRPGRPVRPPRTSRDRRHALRRQPTPRRLRLGDAPSRRRGPSPHGSRRQHVRRAASPSGPPWNSPTPSPTPATRSKPLAAKSPTSPDRSRDRRPATRTAVCVRSGAVGVRPPSGTVTFLFTDVVGSTGLWEIGARRRWARRSLATTGC